MAVLLLARLEFTFRTREAIRVINSVPLPDRNKKRLLAEWFRLHTRAARAEGAKRAAYDQLLGRDKNRKLRG